MNEHDRGAEPAYPTTEANYQAGCHGGLTKREAFAMAAMQGLIATMADEAARLYVIGNAGRDGCSPKERLVAASVEYADALLEALNQESRT